MKNNCQWSFPLKTTQSEKSLQNPLTDIFKEKENVSLIREAIQNSIDASFNNKTVTVQFSTVKLHRSDIPQLFDIKRHVEACKSAYDKKIDRDNWEKALASIDDNEITCLKISDYGTTGMRYTYGDINSPFYSFMSTIGNSTKEGEGTGGSRGYGKGALYLASWIRALLVTSVDTDNNITFMGRTMLAGHRLDGNDYIDEGVFNIPGENGAVTDKNAIPDQFRRTEVGTDIYVLCSKDISVDTIAKIVIENFFMAIRRGVTSDSGGLTVKIDIDGRTLVIDQNTIQEIAESYFPNDEAKTNPLTYINLINNINTDKVKVENINIPNIGDCVLYLMKNSNGEDVVCKMRRQGMVICYQKMQTYGGYVGLFLCRGEGNDLLKKCEDPKHSKWSVDDGILEPEEKIIARKALRDISRFINAKTQEFISATGGESIKVNVFNDVLGIIDYDDDGDLKEGNEGTIRLGFGDINDLNVNDEQNTTYALCDEDDEKNIIYSETDIPEDENSTTPFPSKERGITVGKHPGESVHTPQSQKGRQRFPRELEPVVLDEDGNRLQGETIRCKYMTLPRPRPDGCEYTLCITPILPKDKPFRGELNTDIVIAATGLSNDFYKTNIISCKIQDRSFKVSGNRIMDVPMHKDVTTILNLKLETKFTQSFAIAIYVK